MKPNGIAVLNADDFRVMAMREKSSGNRVMTFGVKNPADVTATQIETMRFGETRFLLNTPNGKAEVILRLVGRHNILNALAAAAVGLSFDLAPVKIAAALGTVQPPPMRGEVLHFAEGFEVINDAYNSNPDALLSMVRGLIENGEHARRKIVVAGEMLELGEEAAKFHHETGVKIGETGIDALFGVRGLARNLVQGAKEAGLNVTEFFHDSSEAAKFLTSEIQAGDLVLIKGSRGVQTEKIVERLVEKFKQV
jgi:UDP-N-acetylmuramoyl-tripeptide--D-alanyl-D-alanine ligase